MCLDTLAGAPALTKLPSDDMRDMLPTAADGIIAMKTTMRMIKAEKRVDVRCIALRPGAE